MANVKKCDRCGKCFDPMEVEGLMCRFKNPIFQDAHSLKENVISAWLIASNPDAWVDLCPECAELFETFMCAGDLPEDIDALREENAKLWNYNKENIYLTEENAKLREDNAQLWKDNAVLKKNLEAAETMNKPPVYDAELLKDLMMEELEHVDPEEAVSAIGSFLHNILFGLDNHGCDIYDRIFGVDRDGDESTVRHRGYSERADEADEESKD